MEKSTLYLKKVINSNLYDEQWIKLSNFIFLWILFEKYILSANSSENGISSKIAMISSAPNISFIHTYAKIKDWYFPTAQSDVVFRCFRGGWAKKLKEIVKNTIEAEANATDIQKLITTVAIIYKYRCNLFHGTKELDKILPSQEEKLDSFNEFLINYLQSKNIGI